MFQMYPMPSVQGYDEDDEVSRGCKGGSEVRQGMAQEFSL